MRHTFPHPYDLNCMCVECVATRRATASNPCTCIGCEEHKRLHALAEEHGILHPEGADMDDVYEFLSAIVQPNRVHITLPTKLGPIKSNRLVQELAELLVRYGVHSEKIHLTLPAR